MTSKRSSKRSAPVAEDFSDFEVSLPEAAPTPALPGPVTLPAPQLIPVPGGVQLPNGVTVPLPPSVTLPPDEEPPPPPPPVGADATTRAPSRGLASVEDRAPAADVNFDDVSFDDTDFEETPTPKRLGFFGQLKRDLAPLIRGPQTPDEFKNMGQSALGGVLQATSRTLSVPGMVTRTALVDQFRKANPIGPKGVTADDWAAAREGEGKSSREYLREEGAPEWAANIVGTAADFGIDPVNLAGPLGKAGKLGKLFQTAEEAASIGSKALRSSGKALYGAPFRNARAYMASKSSAKKFPFSAWVSRSMDENIGRGLKTNEELLDAFRASSQDAGTQLANVKGGAFKGFQFDLAPEMQEVMQTTNYTPDLISQHLRSGTLAEKRNALSALKMGAPDFKPALERLERRIVGQKAAEAQGQLAGLGEDLTRGKIDLDTLDDIRESYAQTAFGSEPMAQNASSRNFRGNRRVVDAAKNVKTLNTYLDDMVDEAVLRQIDPTDAAAVAQAEQASALTKQLMKDATRDYAIKRRGYTGATQDLLRFIKQKPLTVADGVIAGAGVADSSYHGDPTRMALYGAILGAKKGAKALMNPINATRGGLLLRDAAKMNVWDAMLRQGLLKGTKAATATEDVAPSEFE